ncbi:hypothetical protein ABWH91_11120 [Phycisphaerales bacterium ac7]
MNAPTTPIQFCTSALAAPDAIPVPGGSAGLYETNDAVRPSQAKRAISQTRRAMLDGSSDSYRARDVLDFEAIPTHIGRCPALFGETERQIDPPESPLDM